MAKCSRCGRGGLFKKVDKATGLCPDCAAVVQAESDLKKAREELEAIRKQTEDAKALRDPALTQLNSVIRAAEEKRDALKAENESAEAALAKLVRRTEKIKPLAKSIQYSADEWVNGHRLNGDVLAELNAKSIEELLPEPDLQCLTMKALRARYKAIREQIVAVCRSYASKYTTKSNAAMYKLMVLAMEAELETVLYKLQFGRLEVGQDAVRRLTERYYAICADGNQSIAPSMQKFIGQIESLYLDVVATEYEYYVQRERAKEEQRALREQMRQEAEERKALEREKKKVEAEERKYQQEIERIELEIKTAQEAELEILRKRLEEINAKMSKVEERKAEIVNLQNGKAGTVYVISNIGSFGDDVFKIGMTRRLEPEDRVNELGSASVPFPFDIHCFIFSDDAPALENAIHKELNDRRVNKVNLRKEFFRVSIDELQQIVERYDPTTPFRITALAEQYRQSLSITDVPEDFPQDIDDDEDDE